LVHNLFFIVCIGDEMSCCQEEQYREQLRTRPFLCFPSNRTIFFTL
jgi:hypothetical protein